jgi:hypothetical protein
MGMVERVARALCRAAGLSENTPYQGKPMWWSYEATARLVLEAMREPSLDMLIIDTSDWETAARNWNAMIDIALDPGQTVFIQDISRDPESR